MTTIEFNKKLICGNDFVAVEVIDTLDDLKIGNIWLPSSAESNGRLAHCKVTNIGKNAHEKTGVNVGDYVMIDRLSTFAWTAPSAALKYDSVICKTNESKTEFFPLVDSMFVKPDAKDDFTDVGGIAVMNYTQRLNTGVIEKISFEPTDEYPFHVGDRVMLVKGGDSVQFGETTIYIYKKDMIVATIKEND